MQISIGDLMVSAETLHRALSIGHTSLATLIPNLGKISERAFSTGVNFSKNLYPHTNTTPKLSNLHTMCKY